MRSKLTRASVGKFQVCYQHFNFLNSQNNNTQIQLIKPKLNCHLDIVSFLSFVGSVGKVCLLGWLARRASQWVSCLAERFDLSCNYHYLKVAFCQQLIAGISEDIAAGIVVAVVVVAHTGLLFGITTNSQQPTTISCYFIENTALAV